MTAKYIENTLNMRLSENDWELLTLEIYIHTNIYMCNVNAIKRNKIKLFY